MLLFLCFMLYYQLGDFMSFFILTLGCKVNTYESEAMAELLIEKGYYNASDYKKSDIIIVNTCSVTNNADIKSRKLIRRVRRENPKAILVVCGCSVQNNYDEYDKMDIDILIGNRNKSIIVDLINEFIETNKKYSFVNQNRKLPFESMMVSKFTSHTRAFLKIQDGCDNFCSYCIIPFVRGSIRSKDFNEALKEAKALVANGHQEIVLTGIHTGSYNSNGNNLTALIKELSKIKNLKLIRISSIEITELDEEFLDELANNFKIANHLHIPLQAGSNEILKLMNRKYDLDYYEKKINAIRMIRPDISITTDLIVGFPNETDELFINSYEFCKKMNFAKIHVFPYSLRTGTKASLMDNQIDEQCKKMRSNKIGDLSKKLELAYASIFINKDLDVLIEEVFDDYSVGHTSNYLKVRIDKVLKQNKIYKVNIKNIFDDIIFGDVIL